MQEKIKFRGKKGIKLEGKKTKSFLMFGYMRKCRRKNNVLEKTLGPARKKKKKNQQ